MFTRPGDFGLADPWPQSRAIAVYREVALRIKSRYGQILVSLALAAVAFANAVLGTFNWDW